MDSAAAYSTTLPDEGAAAWDGVAFAGRAVVSAADGRYSFEVFSVSGSGDVVFDFGDGETHTVTFPSGTTKLDGEVVDDRSTPLFRHEYAADGVYEIRVTGDLTSIGLTGKHRPSGSANTYSTAHSVVDETAALHEILHMPQKPEKFDMIGWWSVDTAVVDSDRLTWQLPWFEYSGSSVTEMYGVSGPRKLVMRNLRDARPFDSIPMFYWPTVALYMLEEFWAPSVRGFGDVAHAAGYTTTTPFGFCDNLKLLYLPSLTSIATRMFVSAAAEGVKIYVGRLTSVHAEAFGSDNSSHMPTFVTAGHCKAELFCGNERQEVLNMGFPFGASYLKCHCTDVTFDNEGRFWRNSDGRRVDSQGRLVDDQGRFVDEAGHLIKYHEDLARWITCDEHGFYVDDDDLPIDPVTGFWVDREGHVCDTHGRKCDTLGNLVAYRYWNPGSVDDSMQSAWYADDNYGEPGDYRNVTVAEYGPYWQYVVDRLGGKVAARGNVNLGNGLYESGDPRADMWYENVLTEDGYIDYYDAKGFLRARERSYEDGGAVYSVVYDGGRGWHLELYSSGEGG